MNLDAIREWNTHWVTGTVSELVRKSEHERAAVQRMVAEILGYQDQLWSLRPGPRQIGKTTSLGHAMQHLVNRKVPLRSIIFVPLDQEDVQRSSANSLDDIFRTCMLVHTPTPAAPLFLFLDEIQDVPEWDHKLKACWDRYHDRVRVMATGSNALQVGLPADFQNRIRRTKMYSMKFREVVLAHPDLPSFLPEAAHRAELVRLARAARSATSGNLDAFNRALAEFHTFIGGFRGLDPFLRATFLEYCVWGGYPTIRPGCRRSAVQRLEYLESAWSNIAGKDLQNTSVTKVREFRQLFRHIARNPGGKFTPSKIAEDIGVKSDTINDWKITLEHLMLVQQLPPLKPNVTPHGGKDKAYALDSGWYAYWHTVTDHVKVMDQPVIGQLVELVMVDHLRRFQFGLVATTALTVGYIETPEIDVVIELGGRRLFVEAKYRTSPRSNMGEVGGPNDLRIIASRNHFQIAETGGVHHIPAHELALMC